MNHLRVPRTPVLVPVIVVALSSALLFGCSQDSKSGAKNDKAQAAPSSQFGGDAGLIVKDLPGGRVGTIEQDSEGRLVIASVNSNSIHVQRRLEDGSPDAEFGKDGTASYEPDSDDWGSFAEGAVVQDDGSVTAVSAIDGDEVYRFVVARFTADGILDSSFDSDGVVEHDVDSNQWAQDIVADGDRTIIVRTDNSLIVVESDGSVSDVQLQLPAGLAVTDAGMIDGEFMVAMRTVSTLAAPDTRSLSIARIDPDTGIPDPTFGDEGTATVASPCKISGQLTLGSVDDSILAAGECDSGVVVARLTEDGKADSTFGTKGVATGDVPALGGRDEYGELHWGPLAIGEDPSGRILVATGGTAGRTKLGRVGVEAFTPDGQIARDFGAEGSRLLFARDQHVTTSVSHMSTGDVQEEHGEQSSADDALIDQEGRILVVGRLERQYDKGDPFLLRITATEPAQDSAPAKP